MATRTAIVLKFCLCALLAASNAIAADPTLLNLIPVDSGVVIGINVEQISSTRFGQEIYNRIQAQSNFSQLAGNPGFEFLRSIQEVLIAAPANKQKNRGVFLLRGAFDENSLRSLAVGAAESNFQGVRIYTKQQQKQPLAIAVLGPTLIAGGDPQTLRAAIARRSLPGSPDPVLTAKARELGESYDIWLVARASLAGFAGQAPQPQLGALAGLEKSIQQIGAGLKFGPVLRISADLSTRTEQDAAAIASAMKMFIAMSASGQNAQRMKPVLDNLQLRAEANSVKLDIALSEDQIMAMQASYSAPSARAAGSPTSSEVVIQGTSPQNPDAAAQSSPGEMVVTLPGPKPQ